MLALLALTTLAYLAALATARVVPAPASEEQAPAQSPAELAVAASLVLNAILGGVIYALGMTSTLYRPVLGGAVAFVSIGLLALAKRRGLTPRDLARALRDVVLLPFRAAWETAKSTSLMGLGFLFATGFLVVTAIAVYYAPNWRDWDCLWYHESMVGFTIQNHGFRVVELPTYLQKINGYQRFGEMTQLWFGIWAGRPLVEAPNLVFVPLLMGSVYLLAKRYSGDRVVSIGWAVAFLLVPGNARLLQSTMVDPHAAALFVTATFYASEKHLRPREAWLAIVALTMAVGTKTFLLVPGFVLAVLVLVRLVRHRKDLGGKRTAAIIAGGSALLVGMVAFTHLRNYLNFKNPVWPDLSVDVPKLGIHWVGTNVLFDENLPTTQRVNANVAPGDLYDKIVALPWTNTWGDHSWQIADYGPGVSWLVWPVGTLVALVVPLVVLFDLVWKRVRKRPIDEDRASRARLATMLALPTLVAFGASPALYIGRYHTAMVGLLFGLVAWVASHERTKRFAEGVPLVLQVTAIMMTLWTPPVRRYWLMWDQVKSIVVTPYPERELAQRFGAGVHEPTGWAREREVVAGTRVGFDGMHFVSLLWNNRYSNEVHWLGGEDDPLRKADELGIRWIYAGGGTKLHGQVTSSPAWVAVGPLEAERFGTVYRRK